MLRTHFSLKNVNVTSPTGKGTLEQHGRTRWQARRGVNLPPAFVCLESKRGVSISDITRTVHTLGVRSVGEARVKGIWNIECLEEIAGLWLLQFWWLNF